MTSPVSRIILNSFLNRLPLEKKERLLSFLPQEERASLKTLLPLKKGADFDPLLDFVHWSWFIPTLKTYSEKDQIFFLRALPATSSESLREELGIEKSLGEKLSSIVSSFLKQILLNSLTGTQDRLLPPEFLPDTPLKSLLLLSKKELTRLIDLLSLHDLAAEMRQIVETKILKKIYSFLSEEKRKYLSVAMAHKEHFQLPRIGLDKWDGSEEAFSHLLHKRGLARLGIALSGQDPDLIWYLCHRLDIGRGNTLFKLATKEAMPIASEAMVRQIEELLNSSELHE